jgi:hypothetical protein
MEDFYVGGEGEGGRLFYFGGEEAFYPPPLTSPLIMNKI